MQSLAEKVLIPAFIYFFKLLYPFRLSNNGSRFVAAAAGGCILLRADSLDKLGGFAALKHALIDDCTLARRFRDQQFSTWLGLTHSAISLRVYDDLGEIWHMVTRTAFTQLRYSWLLLLLCVCLMLLAFVVPTVGVFVPGSPGSALAMLSLVIMCLTYLPVVRYYRLAPVWVVTLPLAGTLYLLMTIHSALRHQFGRGANWKGRTYE